MRSTPPPPGRRWDGSLTAVHPRRSLRVASDGVSRLLRCGQTGQCRDCGNRIEWYHRTNRQPVRLHPQELPTARVPAACRWHVSSGVAYPAGDGTSWCRLPHAVVCPARDASPVMPELVALRRAWPSTPAVCSTPAPSPRPVRPLVPMQGLPPSAALPAPSCSSSTSATSPPVRSMRSSASLRPDGAIAAAIRCSLPMPLAAPGPCCPPLGRTANSPCPRRSWPCTTFPACRTRSSCAGEPSAARSTLSRLRLRT